MHSPAEIAFDVQHVSYSYNQVPALDRLSLQIRKGERVALLGANGSGKSTLLRLLSALAFPSTGYISFFGRTLNEAHLQNENAFFHFRRSVGIVFQNPDVQLFNASVFDELAFGPLQMRWPKDGIRQKVEQTLSNMGISHLRNRPPHRLSGGEKKRVALASVLVLDPDVLILDEPTAGLDPNSQHQIVELLRSWKGGAKTVITATHDLDTLEDVADRCFVLDDGKVAGQGEPLAILHDIALLERSRLVRRLHHVHRPGDNAPHPHAHIHEHE